MKKFIHLSKGSELILVELDAYLNSTAPKWAMPSLFVLAGITVIAVVSRWW